MVAPRPTGPSRLARHPDLELHYLARVVTPGTYTWEPAVLQSETDPTRGIVLEPFTVTIRGSAG